MGYDRRTTLCFSGHRSYETSPEAAQRLSEAVSEAYRDGFRTFISGVAEGFDLAAAEAVLALREECPDAVLVAAVPFADQAARFSDADRLRYAAILSAADEAAVLSEHYRHGCFFERDDWMIERSSRVICWYEGTPGGTRYTVRSALRNGVGVVNIYREPDTLF